MAERSEDDPLGDALANLTQLQEGMAKRAIRELGNLTMDLATHIEHLNEAIGALIITHVENSEDAEKFGHLLRESHQVVTWAREAAKAAQDW